MTVLPTELTADESAAGAPDGTAAPAVAVQAAVGGKARKPGRVGAASSEVFGAIERRLGVTTIGLGVGAVTVSVLALGYGISSRGMTLLGYGLGMVLAVSWLLGRRNLEVDAERSGFPPRVRTKRQVDVELSLTAKRRITGIILEEVLDAHLGAPVRVPVPVLPGGETMQHGYAFVPRQRGVYRVGPMVAEWSDPFGFTRRRQQIAEAVEIIVHPATEGVVDRITSREWEDPPIRPPVSKPWPVGFEFYGMREYQDGDDPRRIVWRALAQYGTYMVKESEQGITDRVAIYLDTDVAAHSPGADSDTFEVAVQVAASLGDRHLNDGFQVTLHRNSARIAANLRGGTKRIPLLDHFARVEREKFPLVTAMDRLVTDPQRNSHNIIVTPAVSQDVAARIRLLAGRGTSVILVLVLWDDTDPMTLHRASGLGCPVVEVTAGVALQTVFQHVVMARGR
jgi:uncharacterized protein (DUF58 family)